MEIPHQGDAIASVVFANPEAEWEEVDLTAHEPDFGEDQDVELAGGDEAERDEARRIAGDWLRLARR